MNPTLKKIGIFIVAVVIGFIAKYSIVNLMNKNEKIDVVAQLPAVVKKLNANLPQKVDEETVWETATLTENNTLNFNYKVINYNADEIEPDIVFEVKKGSIKNGACKHFQPFFEANIPLQFNYVGKDNVKIGNYYLEKEDCSQPIVEKV